MVDDKGRFINPDFRNPKNTDRFLIEFQYGKMNIQDLKLHLKNLKIMKKKLKN